MNLNLSFLNEPLQIEIVRQQHTIFTEAQISTLLASDFNNTIIGYSANSFEFRSPSEHKIDGSNFDLEMQILHKINDEQNSTNQFAIVSILFKVDKTASQPFFDEYYFKILKHQNTTNLAINFHDTLGVQLNQNPYFYTYMTNYCDHQTQWYILNTPLPISKSQVEQFNKFFNNKNNTKINDSQKDQQQEIGLVKIKGKDCESHLLRDIGLFIGYCAVIFLIYRSI